MSAPEPSAARTDHPLARLRVGFRRPAIPVVLQLTAAECGAACLSMVLGYYGRHVGLDLLRDTLAFDRGGTNADALLTAAQRHGLNGRGVRVEIEALQFLPRASILHWEFNHFVVFDRIRRSGIEIVDPAAGRRLVPWERFRRSFTGVALLLEPGEHFRPEPGDRQSLGRLAWRLLRGARLAPVLTTSLLMQAFALAVPVLTGALVDRVVPRRDYHLLGVLAAGFALLVAFQGLASFVRAHLLLYLRTHVDARMTIGFVQHLVSLPYAYFQRRAAGDLMMRLNSNAVVRDIVTTGALSAMLDGSLATLYLVALVALSPSLGLVAAALGALQVAVFAATRRRQSELMNDALQHQARAQAYQFEMLAGIETLKVLGAGERAVARWSHAFVDVLNAALDRGRLEAIIESLLVALRLASPLVFLTLGAREVLAERLTLGTMLALSALAGGFWGPLSALVSTGTQFRLLRRYADRIEDVFAAAPEQDVSKRRLPGRLTGRIAVEALSFRYESGSSFVLRDVSFDIRPGQFVAIVGRSGAGKTTLASLLMGLYRPTEGRVLYDGCDLADLDLDAVRRQIGCVTQHPYLFGDSIRANIALADPSLSLERVVEAAKLAHVHDDVMAMPMGYGTRLAEHASSISGGQRQRLALARALASRPAILLLDEATSAVDGITEQHIQRTLASLSCTRVVIAQRLSTIVDADEILVLEQGRLVERGTHDALLALGGTYAALAGAAMRV
jgi:ABC-type bacteriocin/lantibiotic exporter with double-glycine peptidase domain